MANIALRVLRLSSNATLPYRASAGAAGYDLASAENVVIAPKDKALVKTDLAIAVPQGYYGRIAPRSSLALKKFIDVGAGVVDSDYRGNVGVVLFNFSNEPFEVKQGDRIAQLILEAIATPPVEEVQDADALVATERGGGGFGSTGV
mmetsp:Transcript_50/g.173  ORF Transcript_50/g.173 Transcript_50/m.173 type:complete len:147 (+) Transcript_50:82-522(+)